MERKNETDGKRYSERVRETRNLREKIQKDL